jgi:predicted permease
MTPRVALFCLVVSVITGVGCGAIPALAMLRRPVDAIRSIDDARAGTTPGQHTLRSALVVIEMSLAVVLLLGAILLVRTFVALRHVDRGFNASQVVALNMSLSGAQITDEARMARLINERSERLAALPGVAVAAASCCMPLESDWRTSIVKSEQSGGAAPSLLVSERVVSADYFAVLGIPLIAGRAFESADGPESQPVAMVDEALARRLWPDGSAIGASVIAFPGLTPTTERPRRIVGIARNVRDGMPLDQDRHGTVFLPLTQMDREQAVSFAASQPLVWLVRAQSGGRTIAGAVQGELRRMNQDRPVTDAQPLLDVVDRSTDGTRFYASIVALFAGFGLALASIGLYAVTTYSVQQRTRELAIRLALGADPQVLRRMVVAHGLRLAVTGAIIGLLAASGFVQFLQSELFGVAPHDPLSFILVPLVLTMTAAAAVSLPAHRATRVDPMTSLRTE